MTNRTVSRIGLRLCTLALLSSTLWVSAQAAEPSTGHDVGVKLPELYGLRIVDSANRPALAPSVTFDYSTDAAGYDAAVTGPGFLEASSVTDFADVQVFVRKSAADFNFWTVQVEATSFGESAVGLGLSDISVERGLNSGLSQDAVSFGVVQSRWALSKDPQLIVFSALGTNGWQSLGFNGRDYRVKVDGDEEPGEYTTTVTYTIVEP